LDDFIETVNGQVSVEGSTTGGSGYDPLSAIQKESISRMRGALLSLSVDDATNVKATIQQVTLLRIHHQIVRIVKYLDIMDKLEDKLYATIDLQLQTMDIYDSATMAQLLVVQSQLQKAMVESHKLLQPYLELQDLSINELMPSTTTDATTSIIPEQSREKLRIAAQTVLSELDKENGQS
jgi:hypothetical protein